jgi:hypothetical protein
LNGRSNAVKKLYDHDHAQQRTRDDGQRTPPRAGEHDSHGDDDQ